LPGDNGLEDTLRAAAASLPESFFLLEAAGDREQSSKYLQFYLCGRSEGKTFTWRNIAIEEPAHVLFKPHLFYPHRIAIQHAKP
jgi:hypothetical protein